MLVNLLQLLFPMRLRAVKLVLSYIFLTLFIYLFFSIFVHGLNSGWEMRNAAFVKSFCPNRRRPQSSFAWIDTIHIMEAHEIRLKNIKNKDRFQFDHHRSNWLILGRKHVTNASNVHFTSFFFWHNYRLPQINSTKALRYRANQLAHSGIQENATKCIDIHLASFFHRSIVFRGFEMPHQPFNPSTAKQNRDGMTKKQKYMKKTNRIEF